MVTEKKPIYIVLGGPGTGGLSEQALTLEVAAKTHVVPITLNELLLPGLGANEDQLLPEGSEELGKSFVPTGSVQFSVQQFLDRLQSALVSDPVLFRGCVIEGQLFMEHEQAVEVVCEALDKLAETHAPCLLRLNIRKEDRITRRLGQYLDPVTGEIYSIDQLRGITFPPQTALEKDDDLEAEIEDPNEEEEEKKEESEEQVELRAEKEREMLKLVDEPLRLTSVEKLLFAEGKLFEKKKTKKAKEANGENEDFNVDPTGENAEEPEEEAEEEEEVEDPDEPEEVTQRRQLMREQKERLKKFQDFQQFVTEWIRRPIAAPKPRVISRLIKRPEDSPENVTKDIQLFENICHRLKLSIQSRDDHFILDIEGTQPTHFILDHFNHWYQLDGCRMFTPVRLAEAVPDVEEIKIKQFPRAFKEVELLGLSSGTPKRQISFLGSIDPVALLETGQQADGAVEFIAQYRNTAYFFLSRDNMKKFMINPDKYIQNPALFKPIRLLLLGIEGTVIAEQLADKFSLPLLTGEDSSQVLSTALQQNSKGGWVIPTFCKSSEQARQMVAQQLIPTHILYPMQFDNSILDMFATFQEQHEVTSIRVPDSKPLSLDLLSSIKPVLIIKQTAEADTVEEDEIETGFSYGLYKDYCPVALRDDGLLCRGRKQFAARYKNVLYLFSTERRRDTFLEKPWKYTGGLDYLKSPPLRLAVVGPQLSGKSTMIKALDLPVPFVDFNEFYKTHFSSCPEVDPPLELSSFERGEDIPSEVIVHLMEKLFFGEYKNTGFVVEGFPRNRTDISACVRSSKAFTFDLVISLTSTEEAVVERACRDPTFKMLEPDDQDQKRDTYSDKYTKEVEGVTEVIEACQEIGDHCFEVGSEFMRAAIFKLLEKFGHILKFRESIFVNVNLISEDTFPASIKSGALSPSQYGRLCPVDSESSATLTKQSVGSIPVVIDKKIFYALKPENETLLKKNPGMYLSRRQPAVTISPCAFICGPSKSGKTVVSRRLSVEYDILHLIPTTVCQTLVEIAPELEVSKQIKTLTAGDQIPDDLLVHALSIFASQYLTSTKGWVLDDFPNNANQARLAQEYGLNPSKVFYLEASPAYCASNALNSLQLSQQESEKFKDEFVKKDLNSRRSFEEIRSFYLDTCGPIWQTLNAERASGAVCRDALLELHHLCREREKYLDAKQNSRPALCYYSGMSPQEIQSNLSQLGCYCPVSLVEDNDLCYVGDSRFIVEYKNKIYYPHNLEAANLFMERPAKYAGALLPVDVPRRIVNLTVEGVKFPQQMEFQGYCAVSLSKFPNVLDGAIPGDVEYVVQFKQKFYTFCNRECLEAFMHFPERYVHFALPFRLPPRKLDVLSPDLPIVNYLEQSIAGVINQALLSVGKTKPKYPFFSAKNSALIYLYYYLKGNNPNASDYSKKERKAQLTKFLEDCQRLRSVAKEMTVNYVHPEQRSREFDKNLDILLSLKSPQ